LFQHYTEWKLLKPHTHTCRHICKHTHTSSSCTQIHTHTHIFTLILYHYLILLGANLLRVYTLMEW
jgi:hypothetical protein